MNWDFNAEKGQPITVNLPSWSAPIEGKIIGVEEDRLRITFNLPEIQLADFEQYLNQLTVHYGVVAA